MTSAAPTPSQTEDHRLFAPRHNFGAGGGARQFFEIHRIGPTGDSSSFAIHAHARELAKRTAARFIVDIGIGARCPGATAFDGIRAERLQVGGPEFQEPLSTSPDAHRRRFVTANIEDSVDLDHLAEELEPEEGPLLIILAEALEYLTDPRPLLRLLRRVLRRHPDNRLLLSTRARANDGNHPPDRPGRLDGLRRWSSDELEIALRSAGFDVHHVAQVPPGAAGGDGTIVAELGCSDASYAAFLARHGLPPAADHLVLTTEHARAERTGGIGTYHQCVEEARGGPRVLLFAGAHGLPADWLGFVRSRGWLHASDLAGRSGTREDIAAVDADEILQAVLHAIFLYDTVRLIEYQDYLGIGARVAQAKRARLLPASVTVLGYAHGSHFYLDHAAGDFDRHRELQVDTRERLSLEQADAVAFPTRFAQTLYVDQQGLRPRDHIIQAYPISLASVEQNAAQDQPIRTLVFYGKRTKQKGYPDFCNAVCMLFSQEKYASVAAQIARIVLMGVDEPDPRVLALAGPEVTYGTWSRAEAVARLHAVQADALVVLPYRGDNHPLSVFEVLDSNCQLLAYDTGGIPELLPKHLHPDLLCKADAASLADAIARIARLTPESRSRLRLETRREVAKTYEAVSVSFKETIARLKHTPPPAPSAHGSVSVIVRGPIPHAAALAEIAISLRNSFKLPAEVVLVDDGISPDSLRHLEETTRQLAPIPARVVQQHASRDFSDITGAAVAGIETPYVCLQTYDTLLLNHYLDLATKILDGNPDVGAVTSWWTRRTNDAPWQRDLAAETRRPLGADLGLCLHSREFDGACAVYRTAALRRLGDLDSAWTETGSEQELLLALAAKGERVWVIPKVLFVERARTEATEHAPPGFSGRLRFAHSLQEGIPLADANSLVRATLMLPAAIQGELARLRWLEGERVREINERIGEIDERTREIEVLRAAMDGAETARITLELRSAQDIEFLHAAVDAARVERDTTKSEATRNIETLRAAIDKAIAERDDARAERDAAGAERDAIATSTFWRMTRPARDALDRARRIVSRLRAPRH